MVTSAHSVHAIHIHSYAVIVQVVRLRAHRQHGQIIVLVAQQVRAGGHLAGQIAVGKEGKAHDQCGTDGKLARPACEAVLQRGCTSVDGVSQCISFGDMHMHRERVCKQARTHIRLWCSQSAACIVRGGIRCPWCRFACCPPFIDSVRRSCPRAAGSRLGIGDR